ncbi:hypothetical protein GCM10011579_057640 [Streptomyces albiflavescens]|uniref:DUF1877 family protein n=1 Tax=Streptomyces albiflavescens TaxID=1623582 RepID=A0A917YAD4_9ACTN|nr:DUF1877 family protein [Streptomyces albiflavescens]GGN76490.1 hypothetical protein GCM10011579_057640 [Streptomyces albiflavescens]
MSIEMQLRAMPESDIREDWAWLEELMGAARDFDRFQAERRAGIAKLVERNFQELHEVYEAAYTLQGSRAWELPVFGGSPVYHATYAQPPFLILRPAQVREVADFLAAVSFGDLWEAARRKVLPPFSDFDEAEVKGWFLRHHTDLQAFYTRTVPTGHAVVKAFWY